jgi:hypothetical protein
LRISKIFITQIIIFFILILRIVIKIIIFITQIVLLFILILLIIIKNNIYNTNNNIFYINTFNYNKKIFLIQIIIILILIIIKFKIFIIQIIISLYMAAQSYLKILDPVAQSNPRTVGLAGQLDPTSFCSVWGLVE